MAAAQFLARLSLLAFLFGAPAVAFAQAGPGPGDQDRQMLEEAADALEKMEAYRVKVEKLQEIVDKEGDYEKGVNCVQAAQQRVDTLIAVASRAESAIKVALVSGQRERAQHEYRKIAVARAKVQQLFAEADACVGGSSGGQDQADVSWTAEGLSEAEDTVPLTEGIDVVGVDPPNTSPFE